MKFKEIFYGLGIRPRNREYPFRLVTYHTASDGDIEFAEWEHPSVQRRAAAGRGFTITQAMVDTIRSFLKPGDVAIDIGAHGGDSSVPIALAVGSEGAVIALEPNVYAFKVLLANAALNRKKTNIFALNIAATAEDGQFVFEYSDAGFCNGGLHQNIGRWRHAHFFPLQVTGRYLPAYLTANYPDEEKRIRYIKIDTEGYDRVVAQSLRPLLLRVRPYLKTEIYKHMPADDRVAYFRELRDLGYSLYRIESEEEDYRGTPVVERDLTRWSHFDMFATPEI